MMAAMKTQLRGELSTHESLANYTTWRVGGLAKQLYRPANLDDLQEFLAGLPSNEPLLWIGLGSNLLIRDGGFNGTVIAMYGVNADVHINDCDVTVGAGVACAKVARQCAREGLSGGAFLAGIPGTMGGALAMNAGAFGGETWQVVNQACMINRLGELNWRERDEFDIDYRHVKRFDDEWFVAARLTLQKGDAAEEQQAIRDLLDKRAVTQPTGKPGGGSTFRNPEGDYAARLIEQCGLKGYQIGGASVSEKHANFIINEDGCSAADIEQLIIFIGNEVERQTGIRLQPEVHVVGDAL